MHGHLPDKNKIDQLMESMNYYQRNFTVINENGEQEVITHTWAKPYPEMYNKNEKENTEESNNQNNNLILFHSLQFEKHILHR